MEGGMMDALTSYRAHRLMERLRRPTTAAAVVQEDIIVHGLAVPYDVPTGDGRMVQRGAIHWDLEQAGIPLIWDREDGDHSGMTLGKVDSVRADDSGVYVEARLFATQDPEAAAAVSRVAELIAERSLGWSIMMDDEEVEIRHKDPEVVETRDGTVVRYSARDSLQVFTSAGFRHLAIVDTPAFIGAFPELGPAPVNAAAVAIATFTRSYFDRWESSDPVPLQVTPDGRVWGHIAGDGVVNRHASGAKYAPDPDPKMRNFHTGTATLDDGAVIRVGSLTCASLHADTSLDWRGQRAHHENSSTIWAKVQAWNDAYGRLCVAGSVVPGLDRAVVMQAVGLGVSPELWHVPGTPGLTLVGAQSVVTPAWPVV